MKREGFSDRQLAELRGEREAEVRERPLGAGHPRHVQRGGHVRRRVPGPDALLLLLLRGARTRASRHGPGQGGDPGERPQPHRPGHRVRLLLRAGGAGAARRPGFETIMVNSNPETVSTDFDVSDKLYFEPLTLEDVLEILHLEKPRGVIVQLGGQTPLKLAEAAGGAGRARSWARRVDAIDRAEDRDRFAEVCRDDRRHGCPTTASPPARSRRWRWPAASASRCWCGRSYVLGGRAMRIVYDEESLQRLLRGGGAGLGGPPGAGRPLPRGRLRGRRGRAVRRHGRGHRRDHAAHRGRRRALGRLGVRAAAVPALRATCWTRSAASPAPSRWSWAWWGS